MCKILLAVMLSHLGKVDSLFHWLGWLLNVKFSPVLYSILDGASWLSGTLVVSQPEGCQFNSQPCHNVQVSLRYERPQWPGSSLHSSSFPSVCEWVNLWLCKAFWAPYGISYLLISEGTLGISQGLRSDGWTATIPYLSSNMSQQALSGASVWDYDMAVRQEK